MQGGTHVKLMFVHSFSILFVVVVKDNMKLKQTVLQQ